MKNPTMKRRIMRTDHLSAWLALPFLIASTLVYYKPDFPSWTQIFNLLFQLTFLIHTLCSIYRFGLPQPKAAIKSIQIYSGYGILVTVILNMVFYDRAEIVNLVFWANWFFVALHVLLAVYLRRRKIFRMKTA